MYKWIIPIVILIFSSCDSNDDNVDSVEIRLLNASSYNYKNITVNTSTGNVAYGDLNAGQKSDYKTFDLAYRYAFVELSINGSIFTIQPIDYVGETPLKNGKYTYRISADESNDRYSRLNLVLFED